MTRVALLIGAQDYDAQNEIAPLSCARNDALVFSRVLQERCGFDTVRVLAGEGIAGSDGRPTKNAIRQEIRRLQKSLVRIELLVVAICAHGWSMRLGGVERFYVAPEDAHSDEPDTLLEYEDLMARLDLIPAEQRAIFLDTCRSLPRPGQRDMGGNLLARDLGIELRDRTIPAEDRTTAVISACSAGESAFEMPEVGHGVFFHFLLQGMEGEAWNAQGLTVNDAFAYARKEIAARPIFRQRPTFNQIGERVIYLAKSKPKDPDGGGDDQKPGPGPDAPQTASGDGSAQPEEPSVTTEPVDTTPKPEPTGQGETSDLKGGGDEQKPEPGPKEPEGTQITEGTERPRRGSTALGAILLLLALFFYILAVVNPQMTRNVAPNGPEPAAPLTARTQTPAAPTPVPQTVSPPPANQPTPQAAPAPIIAALSTAAPAPATPAPQAPVPAPQATPAPMSTPTPTPQPAPSSVPGTTGPAASAPPPQAPAAASQTAQAPRAQAPPPSSGAAAPAPIAAAPAPPTPAPQVPAAANAPTAPPQAVAPSSVRPSSPARGFPVPERGRFRDCPECPEMVVIPAGSFMMGSPAGEAGSVPYEGPQRQVTVRAPLAVGRFEVTFREWDACVAAGGCSHRPSDEGWDGDNRPVINVSWNDAQQYVRWLSRRTGQRYRLLTEAEWEYAARAGTTTPWHTGGSIGPSQAVFGSSRTEPVGSRPANRFGLHDMHGNVSEWVEDCFRDSYAGAPLDASQAVTTADCASRVLRGGSWLRYPQFLRSAHRNWNAPGNRSYNIGFRVARTPGG